jgi:hypothetical protein
LKRAYKDGFKGGQIKSSYEEEWAYSADGVLWSQIGVDGEYSYRWDGEMLIGLNPLSRALGAGRWDGIALVWNFEASNGMISKPTMRFDWYQSEREYHNVLEPSQIWKWTRHFLASKFGAGEWILEGNVPEPVVMFLQIIRTLRLRCAVTEVSGKFLL